MKNKLMCEDGSCFVGGITNSTEFPLMNAYHEELDSFLNEKRNGFLTYFNSNGSLNYSTLLGSKGYDSMNSVEALNSEICFVTGCVDLGDVKLLNPIDESRGEIEGYIAKILNPMADYDHDNLINLLEYYYGADPTNPHSDDDGIPDGDEHLQGTDPTKTDTDWDGLPDDIDEHPTSFFFPTGLIMLSCGVFLGIVTVIGIKAKDAFYEIRVKRVTSLLDEIYIKIENSDYQQALIEIEENKQKVEKLKDISLIREWELVEEECRVTLSFLKELEHPKMLINQKKFQDAHVSLIKLLKRANMGDFKEFLDKKVVSELTDMLKQVSDYLEEHS